MLNQTMPAANSINAVNEPFSNSVPSLSGVPNVHLCSGIYKTTCADMAPVEVFCQTFVLNAVAYVWLDGVDDQNPLLLPVQALTDFRRRGTLREYLEMPKHTELGEAFDDLMDLCMQRKSSATLLVRACEILHAENVSADQALETAQQWGMLFNELDQAERTAYKLVSSEDARRLAEPMAAVIR